MSKSLMFFPNQYHQLSMFYPKEQCNLAKELGRLVCQKMFCLLQDGNSLVWLSMEYGPNLSQFT